MMDNEGVNNGEEVGRELSAREIVARIVEDVPPPTAPIRASATAQRGNTPHESRLEQLNRELVNAKLASVRSFDRRHKPARTRTTGSKELNAAEDGLTAIYSGLAISGELGILGANS